MTVPPVIATAGGQPQPATFVVTEEDAGARLDRVAAARLGLSRGEVSRRIEAGVVRVDGQPAAKPAQRLEPEALVEVGEAPEEVAEPPPPVPVRYRDAHLVVVAKPAGLVVHSGAGATGHTLVDALRVAGVRLADTGDPDRPGIVHRLDRGTSGLLVVASTEAARAGLVARFARHDVERRYTAIVDGTPDPPHAAVDAPIARDRHRRTRFRVDPSGRRALSTYDLVASWGRASHVEVGLQTGRTHQVRVHMAAVGHPVSGDTRYGADRALAADLGLQRPALHAARLGFEHPVTGERIDLEEPLPADLAEALRHLAAG